MNERSAYNVAFRTCRQCHQQVAKAANDQDGPTTRTGGSHGQIRAGVATGRSRVRSRRHLHVRAL